MPDQTPVEKRVRVLQAAGAVVVALATLAAALLGDQYPWVNGAAVLVSAVVGKLIGVPLAPIMRAAFASMPPAKQTELTVQAMVSLPPAARQEALQKIVFLASDRPPPEPPSPSAQPQAHPTIPPGTGF